MISVGAGALAAQARARIGNVEIGVCSGSKNLDEAVKYGFDYLEPAAAEIADMEEKDFQAFKEKVLASPIRCSSFNSFVRKLRVVGDEANEKDLRAYVEGALERCRQLGGQVVVWGSAGSRNVAPGYSRERAWQQIRSFLRMAGEVAKPKGIVVAIEPLRKQESNILNTGAESWRMVRDVRHSNIKMIIDYYHLQQENEDPQIIWEARKDIVHFHFANPKGRVWPKDPAEDPGYARFFEMVKKTGFRGGISIEGRGKFEDDAQAGLAFFRKELSQDA